MKKIRASRKRSFKIFIFVENCADCIKIICNVSRYNYALNKNEVLNTRNLFNIKKDFWTILRITQTLYKWFYFKLLFTPFYFKSTFFHKFPLRMLLTLNWFARTPTCEKNYYFLNAKAGQSNDPRSTSLKFLSTVISDVCAASQLCFFQTENFIVK